MTYLWYKGPCEAFIKLRFIIVEALFLRPLIVLK